MVAHRIGIWSTLSFRSRSMDKRLTAALVYLAFCTFWGSCMVSASIGDVAEAIKRHECKVEVRQ